MIEFVITADELDSEQFDKLPATYVTRKEDEVEVEFEKLDPQEYNTDSVVITENLNGREHSDDYDQRTEDWVLCYEPTL